MIDSVARRTVILGLGQTAALGGLLAALPRAATGAEAAPMKVCLSMLYPSGEGLAFDADAFRDRHIPLLRKLYGPAVERIELRVAPPAPPPPAPPPVAEGEEAPPAPPAPPVPPLLAAVSMWLGDLSEFIKRAQTATREISADMANITKSAPMVQFDVLEGQAGSAATSVIGGSTVISSYFFAKDDGTWDKEYFGKTYAPRLMEAYGPALQRVEVSRGELAQGGGKPLVAGALHLYIKDVVAFDEAVRSEAVTSLGADAQQHSTINPVTLVMTVYTTA